MYVIGHSYVNHELCESRDNYRWHLTCVLSPDQTPVSARQAGVDDGHAGVYIVNCAL